MLEERSTGLTTSLVEEGEAEAAMAVGATGRWQNFPVKFGGQRQRSLRRQMPPFLHSRGQRTAGGKQHTALFILTYEVLTTAAPAAKHTKPLKRPLVFETS